MEADQNLLLLHSRVVEQQQQPKVKGEATKATLTK
jgi:hypothetical protein